MPHVNHLAIPVHDVDQAAAFYQDWLGATPIPSPQFPLPVAWVLLGKVQLHLVQRGEHASEHYHFAVSVEDREQFEALYWRAEREGIVDGETFRHHLYIAWDGGVQLYVKDPSGNLVECDYADVDDLDPQIAAVAWRWSGDDAPEPTGVEAAGR